MIKINFEQKPVGYRQPYAITTEMVLDEDVEIYEAIEAFCKILNIAAYYVTADQIQKAANRLKEDYGNNRIL